MNYPFALQQTIQRKLQVTVNGNGFFFWRDGNEWKAQHPDMNPEHFLIGKTIKELNEKIDNLPKIYRLTGEPFPTRYFGSAVFR